MKQYISPNMMQMKVNLFKKYSHLFKRWFKNNAFTAPLLAAWHRWKYQHWRKTPLQAVFQEIFEKNYWKSLESKSGSGSEIDSTHTIRQLLPQLFQQYHIQTIADIPCGDFNWMKTFDFCFLQQYIGADVVPDLIKHNKKNYETRQISFCVIDLRSDPLPAVDLILVRDCWVHLSFADIQKCINNIQQSEIRYLLATTFPAQVYNVDIITGSWRPINLMKKPFEFPPPLCLIADTSAATTGEFADKSLGLWKISDLKNRLKKNDN